MSVYLQDPDVTLWHGDALQVLREMPDRSANCCVTSPPYWGLRDYGTDGQLGLEATPEAYVTALVGVLREVRRVLTDDATLWLNLGDSYAAGGGNGGAGVTAQVVDAPAPPSLFEPGWYLRSDVIWSKSNPMPESVTDRPTKAHEYVFLLSKRPRYWFDQEAVRERYSDPERIDIRAPNGRGQASVGGRPSSGARGPDGRSVTRVAAADGSIQHRDGERWPNGGRNVRSVWEIATQPYPGSHFATFPEELVRRCILAGCPPGGTVLDPFAGSGTTGLVARKHGRRSVLIELNADYCQLAATRLQQLSLLAGPTP